MAYSVAICNLIKAIPETDLDCTKPADYENEIAQNDALWGKATFSNEPKYEGDDSRAWENEKWSVEERIAKQRHGYHLLSNYLPDCVSVIHLTVCKFFPLPACVSVTKIGVLGWLEN